MKSESEIAAVVRALKTAADKRGDQFYIPNIPSLELVLKSLQIVEGVVHAVLPENPVKEQAKAVSDLIKAGKDNGVRKMKITMAGQNGFAFESPVAGAKVAFSVGSKGNVTVEVEY